MAKSEREQLRDELFGYRKNTKMDKIFVDMFGNWAEDIYKYVGNFFNEEVHEYPEIYKDGELEESATCRKFRQVRKEGNRVKHSEYTNFDNSK